MRIFLILWFLFSGFTVNSQIIINEYLSSNINGILDEDQAFGDWIEIFNTGDNSLNISGYGLSDDISVPLKWTFPDMVIPAKQHVLVFASDKDRKVLPMKFETIIDVGSEWRYLVPESDLGTAWHDRNYNDSSWLTGRSSFGYADNDDTTLVSSTALSIFIRKEFTVTDLSDLGRLILAIDYDDGFVAYINGHEVARANLGSVGQFVAFNGLADTWREATMYAGGNPEYYEISNPRNILIEGNNIIAIQVHNNAAGSSDLSLIPFLTTGRFSDGSDSISVYLEFPEFGGLHTNFKIDADFEKVYLSDNSGVQIDSSPGIIMYQDISYGRKSDGATDWCYFGFPTPGAPNSAFGSGTAIADSIIFSPEGGMHISGVSVTLSTMQGSDSIYYTMDGSVPDTSDNLYTGPIILNSSGVIRARTIKSDFLPGAVMTKTYVMGREHDLPIICLSTEPDHLWDEESGIYAMGTGDPGPSPFFGANFWKDWERPVHMELYDEQGISRIDQDAGMKIFGGWSRSSDQKSISLFARQVYGNGSFKYKFFDDKVIEKFESIILRNSGNDNMGLQFHDCFMTGLTREMDIDRQAYQPAAVYINGEYWGLLNIREKISDNYIAENHYMDPDSVNLLEGNGQVIDGTNSGYWDLTNYINLKTSLQNDADYGWIQDRMNIDNFIQYQLTQIYLNNRDWPGNNIKFWNTTNPDSKWRWILYDTDFGFGIWNVNDYSLNTLDFALDMYGPDWPNPPWSTLYLRRLVTNPGFKKNFVIQFCDRLNQDFHPDRIIADLDSLKVLYENEIVYNFNRWWSNYGEWMWRLDNRKTFGRNRPAYCRSHLKSKFQLGDQLNVTINVSDSDEGHVKLNTIYPKTFPFTGIYFSNIPISMKAIPRPGYRFVRWEGSVTSTLPEISYNMASSGTFRAVFTEAGDDEQKVIINEINYSSASAHDTKDWVELFNAGSTTADLSNWLLIDSNEDSGYVFKPGTLLAPGGFLIVCRNLQNFKYFNPNVNVAEGDMEFGLSSDGDVVRLFDINHRLIDAVNYGTANPWPDNANGTGLSIELINPEFDNDLGENWQALTTGGTPGKPNTGITSSETNKIHVASTGYFDCFPNPFHEYTTIRFDVAITGKYRLEVVDMQGVTVKILSESLLNPGSYWIDWDGEGSGAEGGVFVVRLISDSGIETRKVVKLK